MSGPRDACEAIDFALRRHYSAVFTPEERDVLVQVIAAWDREHPDLPRAERQQAWLEMARSVGARA